MLSWKYEKMSWILNMKQFFSDCVDPLHHDCNSWSLFFEYVNESWSLRIKNTLNLILFNCFYFMFYDIVHVTCIRVDLYSCWDAIHNVIILQHNEIKASIWKSLNLMSKAFKQNRCKRLVEYVSKYALRFIVEEFDWVQQIRFDSESCGCVLRWTYDLPYACELTRYDPWVIHLSKFRIMWTRLSFSSI